MSSTYNPGSFVGDILSLPFSIASLYQGRDDRDYQKRQDSLNRQMQYDFAQNSIKWRVNDAKNAGIHPLYAMGVSPSSAQPVYSSASSDGIYRAYENISRAFSNLQLENLSAQTDKIKAETKAIESQGFDFADTSAPGSPQSQKKTNTQINSSFVENYSDLKKILQESAQDSKISTGAYDALSRLEKGKVATDKELDYLATALSGIAHEAPRGQTLAKKGFRNIGNSLSRSFNRIKRDIQTGLNVGKIKDKSKADRVRKIMREIENQYNSWSPTR